MDSYKKTGIIMGLLFISATVASILSTISLGSILDAPNFLISSPNSPAGKGICNMAYS